MPQQYCAQTVPMVEAMMLVNVGDGTKTVTIMRDIPLPWQDAALETVSAAGQVQCVVLPGNSHVIDAFHHTWLLVVYVGCAGQPTQVALIDQKDQADIDGLLVDAGIPPTGWAILGKVTADEIMDWHQAGQLAPVAVFTSGVSALCLNLYDATAHANGSEPAGWQDLGFDDSAWANPVVANVIPPLTPVAGTNPLWSTLHPDPDSDTNSVFQVVLFRSHVTLSTGVTIHSATLTFIADSKVDVYVNGTAVGTYDYLVTPINTPVTISIDPAVFADGANVIAFRGTNNTVSPGDPSADAAWVSFKITLT